jgi:hypothetical protein
MDVDNLGGNAWRGTIAKDRDLWKVHAVNGGHVISLNKRNDSIDSDITRLALMVVQRSEVRR